MTSDRLTQRDEILLITRIRTLNKGNQALSAAWLAMVQRAFSSAMIRVLERRPRHLLQYTLRWLARERDPFAAIDRLAEKLARMAPGPNAVGEVLAPPRILLDETIRSPQRFVGLRQRLNLRGRAAAIGYYADTYRLRLSACQRARLVIVNPAGEFFPREPQAALYHLLDAHVAQKLGRPAAVVNHTMDISDPTLRAIIPPIYRTLGLVGFRDEKSVAAFRAMGGDLTNVLVTPDLALVTELSPSGECRRHTIAVAVNVPAASAGGYLDRWIDVISALGRAGFAVELVSNELPADRPFYDIVMRRVPHLALAGAGFDHDRYGELLSTYALVVSSRMHTGVLAMCAGTPVVAVEGSSFKITGLFQELGLPRPVIRPIGAHWPDAVLDQVTQVIARRTEESQYSSARVTAARERIIASLVPRLRASAAPAAGTGRPS